MPAVSPGFLIDAILDAIEQSGESATLTSGLRSHPRVLVVTGPEESILLWMYAWTLTPGGRPQLANEYRIQMTSVNSPLSLNPSGPSLLLGYEPSLKMFAGFDLNRHRTFTTGSPSVQIDITSLHRALQDGLAFHRKQNGEVAVAFRPDNFMAYARNALGLHASGRHTPTFDLISKVATLQPPKKDDLARLTVERSRLVQAVSRLSRSANFRLQVLQAYGSRCAMTRMQLRLVEAAHILPVAAKGSPDHVTNGIALSPTYHRAFDMGLIFLTEGYEMRLNIRKHAALTELRLDGGSEAFQSTLGKIHLPPDRNQWPSVPIIRKANRLRAIDGY